MPIAILNTDAGLNGKTISDLENAQTITGLKTFDRDPNAPFAVTSGSSMVSNLDVEKLGGSTKAEILASLYPVGSIYFNASVSTNPGTLLGFGTWAAFGAGRVLVGFDATQTEFDTLEETGGEKTHVLTEAELPNITIGTNIFAQSGGGAAATLTTGTQTGAEIETDALGSGTAHNNLQPYIVVYMWKRTA